MSLICPFWQCRMTFQRFLSFVIVLTLFGYCCLGTSVSIGPLFAVTCADDDHDDDDDDDDDDDEPADANGDYDVTDASVPSNSGVFYVRTSGDDANNGTSAVKAFRTIGRAAGIAPAGSIIYVGGGIYSGSAEFVGIEATSSMPTRLIADTDGIRCGDRGDVVIGPGARLTILGCANVRIVDFTFQGPTDRCFTWRRSTGGVVENCTFIGGRRGVKIRSGEVTFQGCTIRDFAGNGLEVFGTAALLLKDCVIEGSGQSGIKINEHAQISIESSTFRNNAADGLTVDGITSTDDAVVGVSPNALLQQAQSLLSRTQAGTKKGQDKIDGALKELAKALEPEYWINDWHVNDKKVFEKAKKALDKLKDFSKNDPKKDEKLGNDAVTKNNTTQANSLILEALKNLAMLAMEEAVVGSGKKDKIKKAQKEIKKAYKEEDKGHSHHAADKYKKAWEKALEAGGSAQGSMLGGTAGSDNDNPSDALANRKLTISGSSFVNNAFGIRFVTTQTFGMRATDLSQNTSWGIYLVGGGQLQECTISNNGVGGIWLKDTQHEDLVVEALKLQDNVQYGLYAETCVLSFDSRNMGDWTIFGSQYTLVAEDSTLEFNNVTLGGGTAAGLRCRRGRLSATNSTFSQSGYGVAAENCTAVNFRNCTFSANNVGLYAYQNATFLASNSTFTANSFWGAVVHPNADEGTAPSFESCSFHNNAGGLTLVDGTNGNLLLRSGTSLHDNSLSGLHFENCTLDLNDQAGGSNWRTLRNGYGISSYQSTLKLSNINVEESKLYGVRCEVSSVSLIGCTVTGASGVFADAANKVLSLESTRVDATSDGGWGLARYGGDIKVKNSVFNGFGGGIFLYTASGMDQAEIYNSTFGNVVSYGVHLAGGDATVRNTILYGNNASYGLNQVAGQLAHSHNLVHGFSQPFSGTTAGANESVKNPRFVDAAAGDFHLAAGSPAINSGLDLSLENLSDMDGNARPSFKRFEIGAYEYMDPNGSFRVLKWKELR